jgi:hypothetical protein
MTDHLERVAMKTIASRAYLDEHEHAAVARDDVELSSLAPKVAVKDSVASPNEEVDRPRLARGTTFDRCIHFARLAARSDVLPRPHAG